MPNLKQEGKSLGGSETKKSLREWKRDQIEEETAAWNAGGKHMGRHRIKYGSHAKEAFIASGGVQRQEGARATSWGIPEGAAVGAAKPADR